MACWPPSSTSAAAPVSAPHTTHGRRRPNRLVVRSDRAPATGLEIIATAAPAPVAQRGAVSGWIGLPQTLGVLLAVVLVTDVVTGNAGYALLAACVVACVLPFALTTPDPPLPRAGRPPWQWLPFARSFWLSPRRYPDFAWAWLTRFAVNLGNAMTLLYLLYFLRDRLHYHRLFPGHKAEDGLVVLILVYLGGVVVTAVASGDLRPHQQPQTPGYDFRLVMAIAAIFSRCGRAGRWVIAAAAIMGLGFGVYTSVDAAWSPRCCRRPRGGPRTLA